MLYKNKIGAYNNLITIEKAPFKIFGTSEPVTDITIVEYIIQKTKPVIIMLVNIICLFTK